MEKMIDALPDQVGVVITGIVHSHPDGRAGFSAPRR
jgi:hypothetical protein